MCHHASLLRTRNSRCRDQAESILKLISDGDPAWEFADNKQNRDKLKDCRTALIGAHKTFDWQFNSEDPSALQKSSPVQEFNLGIVGYLQLEHPVKALEALVLQMTKRKDTR